jgi:hypothetical protein
VSEILGQCFGFEAVEIRSNDEGVARRCPLQVKSEKRFRAKANVCELSDKKSTGSQCRNAKQQVTEAVERYVGNVRENRIRNQES